MGWWRDDSCLEILHEWAENLIQAGQGCDVVCIGQSPAWVVRFAEILAKRTGREFNAAYVPLSDIRRVIDRKFKENEQDLRRQYQEGHVKCHLLDDERAQKISAYLREFDYSRSGRPKVYVDFARSGESLFAVAAADRYNSSVPMHVISFCELVRAKVTGNVTIDKQKVEMTAIPFRNKKEWYLMAHSMGDCSNSERFVPYISVDDVIAGKRPIDVKCCSDAPEIEQAIHRYISENVPNPGWR